MRTPRLRPRPVVPALAAGFVLAAFAGPPAAASHPEIADGALHCAVAGNDVSLSWNIQFFAPIAFPCSFA